MINFLGTETAGGGFNPLAAGRKVYGGGSYAPTMGRVDPTGYIERDATLRARRQAMLNALKASQQQRYASPAYARGGLLPNGAAKGTH